MKTGFPPLIRDGPEGTSVQLLYHPPRLSVRNQLNETTLCRKQWVLIAVLTAICFMKSNHQNGGIGLFTTTNKDNPPSTMLLLPPFVQGVWAVPPAGCSSATITGAHTILLDPADTGGYTVVFSTCTVTGTLTIASTAAGVAHLNAAVDIQNSAAATLTITSGVLLGAGSRIRIQGLTGVTAATLAGSAQDGAELLFAFVTVGNGGLTIAGTYVKSSRLLVDFSSISTTSAVAINVNGAVFATGSHFNVTNTVAVSTAAAALDWVGTSAASSTPFGAFPTTIVGLTNTSLSGRNAFSMLAAAPGIQSGALLHISGGCAFSVGNNATDVFLSLQLKGGLIYHDATNRYTGQANAISVDITAADAGGNYFALQGATVDVFGWYRAAGQPSTNDTIILENSRLLNINAEVGLATGLNLTLRRVVASSFSMTSAPTLTNASFLIEDAAVDNVHQRASALRTTFAVLRTNLSGTLRFNHPATACSLLIAKVRATNVLVEKTRAQSPARIEDVIAVTIQVQDKATDSGVTVARTSAADVYLSTLAWLRSPVFVEATVVTGNIYVSGSHTDGRVQLNRTASGGLRLMGGSSLVRTALVVQHSVFSTGSYVETIRLDNTWNNAPLDVLNTSVTTPGLNFALYISNAPLNGSQHRFVDSVLVCTTTTYPASGTEPLQGVLVYAAGFGAGGVLEVRGTRLEARHPLSFLLYATVSGSRLHFDGSNACARPGALNRGRIHVRTLTAGAAGDVVRVNNSVLDTVYIVFASGADSEMSVANSKILDYFTLNLAQQTRLVHRMLNTTIGVAVAMTCTATLRDSSILLYELQAPSLAHAATVIDGGCYVMQRSKVTGAYTLNTALTGLEAAIENTTIGGVSTITGDISNARLRLVGCVVGGATTVSGVVSNATLRFFANKLFSLSLVGQHTNTSLAVDDNDLRTSNPEALKIDAGASSNVTWRIQNNNMTGATSGIWLSHTTIVSGNGSMVAIVNNTMGPDHGVWFASGGGIGPGATLWMRDNRIITPFGNYMVNLQLRGGRLDHDGSNRYTGGGYVDVYLATADSGGHYFVLQDSTAAGFSWNRQGSGIVSKNETIVIRNCVFSAAVQVLQQTCMDCVVVVDRSILSGTMTVTGTHTSTHVATPDNQCAVCLLSSQFGSTVDIVDAFTGLASTLQLLNSTFLDSVTVSASFTVTSPTDIVAADIANCTFQIFSTTPLTFSGAFSAVGSAIASLQLRDTKISSTFKGIVVGPGTFGSNSRLYLQNVACTTPGPADPCLDISYLHSATWFEMWNSSFFRGGLKVAVSSAATNMLIVGNRAPLFSITGAVATVGGGRIAACNQDSSTAGWPAVTIGSVGFSNVPCAPAQMVTRCSPASGQIASVTAGGDVPSCLSIPIASTLAADIAARAVSLSTVGRIAFLLPLACIFNYRPPIRSATAPHTATIYTTRSTSATASVTVTEPTPSATHAAASPSASTGLGGTTATGTRRPTHTAPPAGTVTASTSAPPSPSAAVGHGASRTPTGAASPSAAPPPRTASRSLSQLAQPPPSTTEAATTTTAPPPSTPIPTSATATASSPTTTTSPLLTTPTTLPPPATPTASPLLTTTTTLPPPTTPTAPPPPTTPCGTVSAETTSAVLHLPSAGTAFAQSSVAFPVPESGAGNVSSGGAPLTPVWHATAGSDVLAAWFVANIAPHVTCTADPAHGELTCRLPSSAMPADNETVAAAATFEATVQTAPCPAPPLRLVLSLVRPVAGPTASAATVVVFTAGLVGTTAYTLVVEPWAVEPLVLAGILDGPCAPPAVQDTARVAIYALNPFAALEPVLAGGLLTAVVVAVAATNIMVAFIVRPRSHKPPLDTVESPSAVKASIIGKALFPRIAFAVAFAALPGVAWAVATAIQRGLSGAAILGVFVCVVYVVVVPCVGAAVVVRLAPARFVPRRVAPTEGLWWRVLWPSGRWTTDGYTDVSAALNVRGLTAGPRGGELLFVGSSLLATSVFALTVAPPASASCAPRHYAAAAFFIVAAIIVACLRPHRAPITTALTTIILLLAGASTAAVGAVAGDPTAPYAPAAGLATTAMIISIARSVHAIVIARMVTAADKKHSHHVDENHQEMTLTVPDEDMLHL